MFKIVNFSVYGLKHDTFLNRQLGGRGSEAGQWYQWGQLPEQNKTRQDYQEVKYSYFLENISLMYEQWQLIGNNTRLWNCSPGYESSKLPSLQWTREKRIGWSGSRDEYWILRSRASIEFIHPFPDTHIAGLPFIGNKDSMYSRTIQCNRCVLAG